MGKPPKSLDFNAIKSKEISIIYKDFIRMAGIFIPKKLEEKMTSQDTEKQKK